MFSPVRTKRRHRYDVHMIPVQLTQGVFIQSDVIDPDRRMIGPIEIQGPQKSQQGRAKGRRRCGDDHAFRFFGNLLGIHTFLRDCLRIVREIAWRCFGAGSQTVTALPAIIILSSPKGEEFRSCPLETPSVLTPILLTVFAPTPRRSGQCIQGRCIWVSTPSPAPAWYCLPPAMGDLLPCDRLPPRGNRCLSPFLRS